MAIPLLECVSFISVMAKKTTCLLASSLLNFMIKTKVPVAAGILELVIAIGMMMIGGFDTLTDMLDLCHLDFLYDGLCWWLFFFVKKNLICFDHTKFQCIRLSQLVANHWRDFYRIKHRLSLRPFSFDGDSIDTC